MFGSGGKCGFDIVNNRQVGGVGVGVGVGVSGGGTALRPMVWASYGGCAALALIQCMYGGMQVPVIQARPGTMAGA